MNIIVHIIYEKKKNLFYPHASIVGCGSGDQPGHHPCLGECAEEVVPHVCWGAGQVQTGQHHGWHLWGDSPQGHPEDIWGQGSRYHWRPQEEPCSLRPHCAEKVSWFCTLTPGLNATPYVSLPALNQTQIWYCTNTSDMCNIICICVYIYTVYINLVFLTV